MTTRTIPAVFREQVAKLHSRPMIYSRRDRHWRPLTWLQINERVDAAAAGLLELGVEAGERVAIIGQSSVEWVIADLAILSIGAATVAISETASMEDIDWILSDSGVKAVFVGEADVLRRVAGEISRFPDTQYLVAFHSAVKVLDELDAEHLSLLKLENLGRPSAHLSSIPARIDAIKPSDLMTLIYTSGTTGQPKGVMISHENMTSNCEACLRAIPISHEDVLLSFLPLSHSFERMAGYYMPSFFGGATIYYSCGMDRLLEDLEEVRPTLMTGVPRLYEKVYRRAQIVRRESTPAKRLAMGAALSVGARLSRKQQTGRQGGKTLNWQYGWLRDKIFRDLHDRLGGRLRILVSGGAALAPEIAEFFFSSGVLILEGYGLTETSPVVSVNRPENYRFGSVGQALDNVRVRIATDGEIMVKAPSVMQGYWKQPSITRAVLSDDGWLATGDIGRVDRDGFVWITDRKKDLFKDSGGRYVAPQRVESLLRLEPMIEQACLIGDNRPYCIALIVPAMTELEAWAKKKKLFFREPESLLREPKIRRVIEESVNRVNQRLAKHETVRDFELIADAFSTQESLLTPSLKIRRDRVVARYADRIDRLYFEKNGS
ncbi:MAG: long-chain fatty acid--CoA ligase [Myxococcota bacterium]|nr:long-chain fatty acid--CoA ligase [Myxococcota bacterium]